MSTWTNFVSSSATPTTGADRKWGGGGNKHAYARRRARPCQRLRAWDVCRAGCAVSFCP